MSEDRRSLPKGTIRAVIISLFLPLFAAVLSGQSHTPFREEMEGIRTKSKWNLGPLWIDPSLHFDLSYDNNIYGTYRGQTPVADYVGTLGVPINIYLPFRDRLLLTFTDVPEYLYFFRVSSENSFNNSYFLRARLLLLNRLVLSGSYGSNRAKYRISSEIEGRVFEQDDSAEGSLFYETPRGSAVGVVASTSRYSYKDELLPGAEAPLSTFLDRKEDNLRLEFYRPAFASSSLFLNVGYSDYSFDSPLSRYRDSRSFQAYAGIRFPILGRARGLLSLGYKNFSPRDPSRKGYSGPVGNTGLDFRFGRFGLRLQAVRDAVFSYFENSIFYIDSRLGAGLSFYLTRNIRLDYDAFWGRGDYPEETLVFSADGSSQEIKRKDIYLTQSGSVVFRILRNTGIGLKVSYWKRDSNFFVYNNDRWISGVFLSYDF